MDIKEVVLSLFITIICGFYICGNFGNMLVVCSSAFCCCLTVFYMAASTNIKVQSNAFVTHAFELYLT